MIIIHLQVVAIHGQLPELIMIPLQILLVVIGLFEVIVFKETTQTKKEVLMEIECLSGIRITIFDLNPVETEILRSLIGNPHVGFRGEVHHGEGNNLVLYPPEDINCDIIASVEWLSDIRHILSQATQISLSTQNDIANCRPRLKA